MGELNISGAEASDLTNATTDYSVDPQSTEGAGEQKETTWQMTDWTENLGYYKTIPELKTAIDTKANWTVGAGFEADEFTTILLMEIKGNGKDTFNGILKNMSKVKDIGGDSFAEIIVDKHGVLANLKPLDPSSMIVVQNRKGRILRYEQATKRRILWIFKKGNTKFKPEQIFHLSRERVADEMHGTGVIPSVKWIINARNEAMTDMKKLMHRHVIPRFKYTLDSDDPVKIAAFKKKEDAANAAGENIYIPKDAVEVDLISVPPNATLNPLAWIDSLNDYFFQAVNVPQIIIGNAKEFTDASGKIVYLSYEQSVKANQLYLEEQVLAQLNIEIRLTFPASLQNEAISDQPSEMDQVEEEGQEQATQPNDAIVEEEGKT